MDVIKKYIVDDDVATTKMIEHVLSSHGISHFKIFHTAEDFRKNYTEDIELCIVDYYLDNNENGRDMTEYITRLNSRCRIVVMSNNLTVPTLVELINIGAMLYMVDKQRDNWLNELVTLINRACDSIIEDRKRVSYYKQAKFSNG